MGRKRTAFYLVLGYVLLVMAPEAPSFSSLCLTPL